MSVTRFPDFSDLKSLKIGTEKIIVSQITKHPTNIRNYCPVSTCMSFMERSPLSNILNTTRLLTHFNSENVGKFKRFLFDQLDCENEALFLCKLLPLIYKTLSHETICIIKNFTIGIAEKQQIENKSVYKYVQLKYKDNFSRMNSDLIDYFGTFLSKKQSIEFGYLNKQLYIETQKQSYLLQRCKDVLYINEKQMRRMIDSQCYPFSYTIPTILVGTIGTEISGIPLNVIKQFCESRHFVKLFCRINSLQLSCDEKIYQFLPIELIFNTSDKFLGKKDKIDLLFISMRWFIASHNNTVDAVSNKLINKFCENVRRYRRCNGDNVRRIEQLSICSRVTALLNPNKVADGIEDAVRHITTNLVCSLSPICNNVDITGKVSIDNYDDLKSVFHSNLKRFGFDAKSELRISIVTNNEIDNNKNTKTSESNSNINSNADSNNELEIENSDRNRNDDINEERIEKIDVDIDIEKFKILHFRFCQRVVQVRDSHFLQTIEDMDMYGLRGNIEKIEIDWPMENQENMFFDFDIRSRVDMQRGNQFILNKLIFLDKKNSPNVKQIEFIIDDDYSLHRCATILIYLMNMRKVISHIEYFEIVWMDMKQHGAGSDNASNSKHIQASSEQHEIFNQNKNGDDNKLECSVKCKIMQCTNCDLSIKSIGIIYAKLIDWFQKIEAKCGINKNSVKDTILRVYPKIQ